MQRLPSGSVRHAVIAAAVLGVAPGIVCPGTGHADFSVSVTVIDRCTIDSRGMSFSSHAPGHAARLTARGAISARCAKGDAVAIALNQGVNPAPGSTAALPVRRMTDGSTGFLPYRIDMEPLPRLPQWNLGTPGENPAVVAIATGMDAPIVLTGVASLPVGAREPPGHYVDVVIATITF